MIKMINTVLGRISEHELGHTRIHEHITWGWTGCIKNEYNRKTIINVMLPHLKELKDMGCDTLVEATTDGAGRDVSILIELSEKSELNIITNCGVWDGLDVDYKGKYVPTSLKNMSSNKIAEKWINEYDNGIGSTSVKPGFIKIGLGDKGIISDFKLTFLKAAIITSKYTGLPIMSHICSSNSVKEIIDIIIGEDLELNKFIWSHADYYYDSETILELIQLGVWIEMSWHISKIEDYNWYIKIIKNLNDLNLLDHLLVSQDAGGFHKGSIISYTHFYTGFVNECLKNEVSRQILDRILIMNPMNVLSK